MNEKVRVNNYTRSFFSFSYIKIWNRINLWLLISQIQTQTHDDNAEKEIQTNDIDFVEKWTQHPIVLMNGLDCSSLEYLNVNERKVLQYFILCKNYIYGT